MTIRASHTITFIAGKPGLYTGDGPDYCGAISVAPLDLDAERLAKPTARTIGTRPAGDHLRPRARNSHKGSMAAPAFSVARAAWSAPPFSPGAPRCGSGSGRVYLGLLDRSGAGDRPAAAGTDAASAGCTARRRPHGARLWAGDGQATKPACCSSACALLDMPLLLDADALNLLAGEPSLQQAVYWRAAGRRC
jgi:hypothetical protein